MLGKGLFVTIFLANVLIISVTGKTLLIETDDEQDTPNAVAQGYKRSFIGIHKVMDFDLFLDYMAAADEPDDDEFDPNAEYAPPITEAELELPRPKPVEDWSNIPEPWVKTRKLIDARCKRKTKKYKTFCTQQLKIRW